MNQKQTDKLYMDIALRVSKESKAKRLKVGAILVKDGQIVIGYNGTRSGANNECEVLQYALKPHPTLKDVELSTFGDVLVNGVKKHTWLHKKGYEITKIGGVSYKVHQLMQATFFENPDVDFYTELNHIDSIKTNNRLTNLELCSSRYNSIHRSSKYPKTSKYPLVNYDKTRDKWVARYYKNGKMSNKRFAIELNAYKFAISEIDPRHLTAIQNIDYLKTKSEVIHAESNLASKLMKSPINSTGATVYVTHSCCIDCAKILYQAGVERVVYNEFYKSHDGMEFLEKCDIEVVKFEDT